MRKIFVAHTPYHLLLSVSLIQKYGKDIKKTLLVHKDFTIENNVMENLNEIFDAVYVIQSNNKYCDDKIFTNYYNKLKLITSIKHLIDFTHYDEIFIFNDNNVIDKKIIQLAKSSSNCVVNYVEDGSAAYNGIISQKRNLINLSKAYIKKVLFGLKEYGSFVDVIGANNYIDKVVVMFPDLIRKELQTKCICGIDKKHFIEGIDVLYKDELTKINLPNNSVVIFLDLLSFVQSLDVNYIGLIERMILHYKDLGKNVYVKYHPRETNYYLKNSAFSYKLIDNSIPSEVLMRFCNNNTDVIASISTTLLTATLFEENIRPISFIKLLNYDDKNLQDVFMKFDIFMPQSISDFRSTNAIDN